jgi:hypothetical protein
MVQRRYLYVFALVIVVLGTLLAYQILPDSNHHEGPPDGIQLSDSEIVSLVYNTSYLGYHSTVWGSGSSALAPSPDLEYPSLEGMDCPVYYYESVDLTEDYVKSTVKEFFPDIDLDTMEVHTDDSKSSGVPYIVIENETIVIHLLRNRGISYELKRGLLKEEDTIGSVDEAEEIALDFLDDHGGVPDDISSIEVTPSWTFRSNGSIFFGHYYVGIYRKVDGYEMRGHFMDSTITFEIDSSNQEIVEFSWHWPKFREATVLEEVPSLESVLDSYGMNSTSNEANITSVELSYMLPYIIQPNGYAASADLYLVAPYWVVSSDDGKYYYLGLVIPDKISP